MEAFNEPMRQLITDISAFRSSTNSTVDSDRANVLAAFRSFVGAVGTFVEHLHHQLHRGKIASLSASNEVATIRNGEKADLLLRSKHMLKVADNAVTNIQRLKRLALDLQHRASKLREAIDGQRVQLIQKSKVDEAQIVKIEGDLEKCLASMKEADTKLQRFERDLSKAEGAEKTTGIIRSVSWMMIRIVPVLAVPFVAGSEIYIRVVRHERDALKLQKESVEREASDLGTSMTSMKARQSKTASDLANCEGQLTSAAQLLDALCKSETEAIDLRHLDALKQAASRFVRYVTDLEGDVYTVYRAQASLELWTNVRSLVEGMNKVEDREFALALHPLRRLVGLENGRSLFVWFFFACGLLWLIVGEISVSLAE